MSEEKLPRGWSSLPLEDISDFVIGGDWGVDPESEINEDYALVACIRGSEIKNWRVDKGKTASLRLIKQSSLEKRQLRLGDLLIEISGGGPDQPVGRVILIDEEALSQNPELPKIGTNFLRLIRLVDGVNSSFINYYLQKFYITGKIVEYQGGSNNLRNLKYKEFSKIEIPLPPLHEQQRIVAKLDAVFGHLDRVREKLDRIPELLKNFRQQVLTQAVTGELTREWREGKDLGQWEELTLGDLFEVKTGGTPRRGVKEYYEGGTIPWVKSGLVKNELIFEADEFITELAIRDSNVKIFPVDTLLVAMYGEGKTRGQVGWLKIEATTNQAIAALVNETMPIYTRTYVFYYCLSQYNDIRAKAEGGNQPNLNLSKIKEWEISVPPEEEQKEIVSRIDSFFNIADKIESQYQSLKSKIDQMPQAILAKAFRGGLVGQEVKEYVREIGELGMVAEGDYFFNKKIKH